MNRERDEAEELRPHAPFDHPRQIDVAPERGARQGGLMARVEIVADPSAPHERVGVEVDGGVSLVEGARFGGALHGAGG